MEMIVDQQHRREQELQFVQQFEMIKNEKSETDLNADTDKIYQDLSAKKQKLDH